MAQFGERLALAAGLVLRNGKVVMSAMSSPKKSDGLSSGSPSAPPSQGPAIVADEPGQADFVADGQASSSPARLLRRMRTALARVGGGGRPAESVEPSSLTFQGFTPERPKRPELAQPSGVEAQADASEQILKALQRVIASQERMHAEVKAEVKAVTEELQQVRAEVQEWRAEMDKKVRTVELNEAQLRAQILGTAEGLVRVEQELQQEVAKMFAKLEMMQNEQEKKKGNEEDRLNALVREHVKQLEEKEVAKLQGYHEEDRLNALVREHVKQLEEKEVAKLREYQQSLEEWLKRSQKEFKLTIAGKVDKFIHVAETQVTTVLEKCEKLAEQLRQYETPLKFDDQWPQLEQEGPEQGQPTQKQREAPAELRYETEKLADNDQVEAQEEHTLDVAEVAADAQEMPTLTQSEENEVAADTHNERSRRSTLPYGDQEEHETTAKYLPGSVRAPTVAAGTSTGVASDGPSGFSLGATKSAAPVQPASAAVKNSAERGQEAASELPSLADMFKPKPGEWDCQTCKTRNKPTDTIRCMACGEKPGAPAQAVLVLRDMAGVVQNIQVRVSASTSVSQVRTEASHVLRRRGVHSEIVSKLIRPDGTELHSVGPYYLMHLAEDQTLLSFEIGELIAAEGLDEKESDSDIVIRLQESKLDVQDEAAAVQADAIFAREADAIVARVAAKFRAEMAQLLSLSQEVAVA